MIEYSKLQIGCMLIVIYIAFIYFRERYAYKVKKKEIVFELLLFTGIVSIAFDGITAYTVNSLNKVPVLLNDIFHACFLCSLDAIVFLIFLYIMVAVYMLGSVMLLVCGKKNMGHNKLITITTCIVAALAVTVYQMIHPQALLTSLVSVFVIIDAYLNMENPLLQKLSAHNKEMVMGFATLVENRDGNTGGHIRRTTTYVERLAKEMKNRGLYKDELTEDYIKNLVIAAPMHGIMAVADVFDAVSAKRCYRDAMPLEQCFSIIENGSGQDFDPYITDVFLDMKEIITNIVESS